MAEGNSYNVQGNVKSKIRHYENLNNQNNKTNYDQGIKIDYIQEVKNYKSKLDSLKKKIEKIKTGDSDNSEINDKLAKREKLVKSEIYNFLKEYYDNTLIIDDCICKMFDLREEEIKYLWENKTMQNKRYNEAIKDAKIIKLKNDIDKELIDLIVDNFIVKGANSSHSKDKKDDPISSLIFSIVNRNFNHKKELSDYEIIFCNGLEVTDILFKYLGNKEKLIRLAELIDPSPRRPIIMQDQPKLAKANSNKSINEENLEADNGYNSIINHLSKAFLDKKDDSDEAKITNNLKQKNNQSANHPAQPENSPSRNTNQNNINGSVKNMTNSIVESVEHVTNSIVESVKNATNNSRDFDDKRIAEAIEIAKIGEKNGRAEAAKAVKINQNMQRMIDHYNRLCQIARNIEIFEEQYIKDCKNNNKNKIENHNQNEMQNENSDRNKSKEVKKKQEANHSKRKNDSSKSDTPKKSTTTNQSTSDKDKDSKQNEASFNASGNKFSILSGISNLYSSAKEVFKNFVKKSDSKSSEEVPLTNDRKNASNNHAKAKSNQRNKSDKANTNIRKEPSKAKSDSRGWQSISLQTNDWISSFQQTFSGEEPSKKSSTPQSDSRGWLPRSLQNDEQTYSWISSFQQTFSGEEPSKKSSTPQSDSRGWLPRSLQNDEQTYSWISSFQQTFSGRKPSFAQADSSGQQSIPSQTGVQAHSWIPSLTPSSVLDTIREYTGLNNLTTQKTEPKSR